MHNQTHPARKFPSLRLLAALLALAVWPALSGCVVIAAGAVGAGAVAFVRGELATNVEHDLDAVYRAAQTVLARQEFARIEERKSGQDAQLVYRTALDKRVEIKLEKVTARLTRVGIRVGLVGDQVLSLTLLDQIRAELE
ncbi:hypothetical protein Verru16b_00794 [Lacunisphaera limnophila]|uniref:DUF3568 domain-containing protein n=1 Tax=Lacunisphaera limnophila TaxID=1838286 RepID=A0A1D8ASA2_9BACT|nr:DUF3568 family protein [Lacunisphaera limnophila]AOS43739.1 hypothetical protein Verru16b_00794 [Lacunisphaera limnophila]